MKGQTKNQQAFKINDRVRTLHKGHGYRISEIARVDGQTIYAGSGPWGGFACLANEIELAR